jgi:hypothetical protein
MILGTVMLEREVFVGCPTFPYAYGGCANMFMNYETKLDY